MERPVVQRLFFPIVLALAILLVLGALWMAREAREDYEPAEAYPPRQAAGNWKRGGMDLLSLQEIIRRLDLPPESRILEVEREERNGRQYYEIELLMPEGHVQELYVDPRTAEVVATEEEEGEEPRETAAGRR